jgi:hypothetical protein
MGRVSMGRVVWESLKPSEEILFQSYKVLQKMKFLVLERLVLSIKTDSLCFV